MRDPLQLATFALLVFLVILAGVLVCTPVY